MTEKQAKITKKQQELLNRKLAPIYRNIGGLTFAIGLVALVAGLKIDRIYNTRPIFTLVFIGVSFPLVLFLNSRILRKRIAKAIEEIKRDSTN